MQTKINAKMAMGIPGTHGNGQPYFADPYITGASVVMGAAVKVDSNGHVVNTTDSTGVGIAVSPQEHVHMSLPSSTATLTVPAGTAVGVAKKGSWIVAIPTSTANTEAGVAAKAWIKGAKLNYAAYNATSCPSGLTVSGEGTVAEILDVEDFDIIGTTVGGTTTYSVDGKPVALIRFL